MSARVIKSGESSHAVRVAPLELRDVERAGDEVLQQARRTAERIVAEARDQSRALREETLATATREGHERGHAEGLAAGLREGRETAHAEALAEARQRFDAECSAARALVVRLADEWQSRHQAIFSNSRQSVFALLMAIVRKVIPCVTETHPSVATDTLSRVLSAIGQAQSLIIVANPADAQALRDFARLALPVLPADKGLALIEDPSVERGGLRIEHAGGAVDATITTQIDRIAQELRADWQSTST